MKTPPKQPAPKGGVPLPPGARNVPASAAYRALQGAPHPGHVEIGKDFVASPKGGPELIIGKKHVHIKGDKPRDPR